MPLNKSSMGQLKLAHPLLQKLVNGVLEDGYDKFVILESMRGKAEQERAKAQKFSKADFGQSPHNYDKALALDIVPLPIQFTDAKPFVKLFREIILPKAKKMAIPVRWLGDPDFNPNTNDGWDFPHLELHPWRKYAKGQKLYQGK